MSENETSPKSSTKSIPRLKDGEEPIGVLLGLVSSDLVTLIERKAAQVLTANTSEGSPVVIIVFANTLWQDGSLVLANEIETANTVANTSKESEA